VVVEVLRFCIVLFLAALGYELARGSHVGLSIGPFDEAGVGTLLGAAAGYVVGGVVGRLTTRSLQAAENALVGRSAEQVLAGLIGAIVGVVVGGCLSWPLVMLGQMLLTLPVLVFVCVTTGTLGYRVGVARRAGILSLIGPRTGLAAAPSALTSLPRIVDTSIAVDGRVLDVIRAGFLHGVMLVPQPVIEELQGLADAADDLRRAKGRRGLDTLDALRRERGIDFEVISDEAREVTEVDAKLLRMTLDRGAALLTLDSNLAKAASLAGCRVMNLHALTVALRPPVTAGDSVLVHVTRAGKEAGQGVGYLDDGTMIVIERARERIGADVLAVVTSVLTTANGRMVFARIADVPGPRVPGGPTTRAWADAPSPSSPPGPDAGAAGPRPRPSNPRRAVG
jgi:uncharacterized protein YacL